MLIKEFIQTKIRRNNIKLKLFLYKNIHFRYFSFSGLSTFSKTIKKHRSLRTKKKKKLNLYWNYHKSTNFYKSLNVVLYIFFSLKIFKFIMIIKNSSGVVCSKLATTGRNLFSYFFFKTKQPKNILYYGRIKWESNKILSKLDFESFVFLLKRRSFVNCVELFFKKGHQYARALGSKARLLDIDKKSETIQIELPSKEIKIFDMYSTCNKYPLLLNDKRKLLFDNKRYKRLSGFGPLVRGVAMNAIDHPHGGKTKSIKYPKTPWGLTTKFK